MNKTTKTNMMRKTVLSGVLTMGMLGGLALTTSAAAPPDHDRGGQRGQEGRGFQAPDRNRNAGGDRGRTVIQQDRDRGARVDERRSDGDRFRGGARDGHDRDFDHDRFVVRTYVPYSTFVAPVNVGAIAEQNGYRNGYAAGQYDAYNNYRRDCDDNAAYRNGLAGYIGTYGATGFYQSNYRVGFERGYNDGFNSVR